MFKVLTHLCILIYRRYTHTFHIEVGYYIRNEYAEPFDENSYPNPVDITKLYRNVVAHEPHVTVTPINWEGSIPLSRIYYLRSLTYLLILMQVLLRIILTMVYRLEKLLICK